MNGIVVCSLSSGILLFSDSYANCFGLGNMGSDAMQLASTFFAFYQMSTFVEEGGGQRE